MVRPNLIRGMILLVGLASSSLLLLQFSSDLFRPRPSLKLSTLRISNYSKTNSEPLNNRIFFHETSGANFLRQRQLCTVESAALHNPSRPIQLFMHSDNQPNRCSSWIEVITRYPNIEIVILNETLFFDDTPFQGIYEDHFKTKRNVNQSRRLSEYARLISSTNGGGTYMDLDFVLLKQLDHDSMGNFFAFEANASSRVANSVYHLNFGHQYLAEIVDFIAQSKDLRNISTAINHVMRKHCPEVNNSNVQSTECADLSIYSYDTFHPIASDNANINYIIFYDVTSKEQVRGINNSTVAVHIWDEESHSFPITYDSNYLIGALAKKNCPYTVELALKRSA